MVKSFNHLFEKVIEDANLETAILTPVKQKIRGKARKTAQYILEHFDETKKLLKEIQSKETSSNPDSRRLIKESPVNFKA